MIYIFRHVSRVQSKGFDGFAKHRRRLLRLTIILFNSCRCPTSTARSICISVSCVIRTLTYIHYYYIILIYDVFIAFAGFGNNNFIYYISYSYNIKYAPARRGLQKRRYSHQWQLNTTSQI
jgi:hypothetical protein